MANDPSPQDPTLETYERIAPAWADAHDGQGFWHAEYEAFRAAMPCGRVLEVGIGFGRDAERLVRDGYDYIGIEPCDTFADMSALRLSGISSVAWRIHRRCTAIDAPISGTAPFDGCIAFDSLLHVPHGQIEAHLQRISHVLRRGGAFACTLKRGDGEGVVDRSKGVVIDRRFFALHQPDPFLKKLAAAGFEPVGARWTETRIGDTDWLFFLMRKR
jgi:SAM-dependent methyltransferase